MPLLIAGIVLVSLACVALVGYILFRPIPEDKLEQTVSVAPAEEPQEWVEEDEVLAAMTSQQQQPEQPTESEQSEQPEQPTEPEQPQE